MARLTVMVLAALTIAATNAQQSSGVLDEKSVSMHLVNHFKQFETARHPRAESRDAWLSSRSYVRNVFSKIGMEVEEQCFNTTVTMAYEQYDEVIGCNIIATHNGAANKNLVVVGAHYDSSGEKTNNRPLRDNGVGASVLLEVARAYEDSIRWKGWFANFTTVFVAFDLNTREQNPESVGHTGSYYFVQEWLVPKLKIQRTTFGGAFILDSISTYNTEENSQVMPSDFKTYFEDAYMRIADDNRKGDFIAVVADNKPDSHNIAKEFSAEYRKSREMHKYRLQEMLAGPKQFGDGATSEMFDHQATHHFWSDHDLQLAAVLITDTDNNRVLPASEDCAIECNYVFANKDRMEFISHTYTALTNTVLRKQATYVGLEENSAEGRTASLILSAVAAFLVVRNAQFF